MESLALVAMSGRILTLDGVMGWSGLGAQESGCSLRSGVRQTGSHYITKTVAIGHSSALSLLVLLAAAVTAIVRQLLSSAACPAYIVCLLWLCLM